MKVLHVNDCAGVAANLVHGLRAEGVDAELFLPSVGTYRTSMIHRINLPIIRTIEAFQLRRRVLAQKIDIVHIHYARFAYMALITNLTYVLHSHGSDIRLDLTRPALKQLTRISLKKAQKNFYVTPELRNYLVNISNDAIFLPNPLNTEEFSPHLVEKEGVYDILCISKMDEFKGVKQIIKTIKLVWAVRPNTKIAMFGFGNSFDEAKEFIEQHRTDPRVDIFPPIPHKKMSSVIQSAKVVLGQQSSIFGSLTLSELEAMACTKPVVCNFQYPDAYKEPPPILASFSAEEACEHIIRLLDDPWLRQSVGRQARQWVEKYHGLLHVTQTLLGHYNELLSSQ